MGKLYVKTNCACRRYGRSPSPTAWFTQNGWAMCGRLDGRLS